LESDNLVFLGQEHVIPHIGTKARPVAIIKEELVSRVLRDPYYDYEEDAALVIENVAHLSDIEKVAIEFIDNKIIIAG
jgi:hypothetical protein